MSGIGYYRLTHRPTGKFYVGSSGDLDRRMWRHRTELSSGTHPNRNLQDVYTNWDDFEISITYTTTLEEARHEEQQLINRFVGTPLCCNVSISSVNGIAGVRPFVPKETRIKNLEKANEARRGVPLSDEHRRNLSVSHSGKVLSEEHKAKLSSAKLGTALTDQHREAIRQGNLGKTRSEEHKRLIGESKSRKVSIDGVVYPSLKSAASAVSLSDVTVRKRLNDPSFESWFYVG